MPVELQCSFQWWMNISCKSHEWQCRGPSLLPHLSFSKLFLCVIAKLEIIGWHVGCVDSKVRDRVTVWILERPRRVLLLVPFSPSLSLVDNRNENEISKVLCVLTLKGRKGICRCLYAASSTYLTITRSDSDDQPKKNSMREEEWGVDKDQLNWVIREKNENAKDRCALSFFPFPSQPLQCKIKGCH